MVGGSWGVRLCGILEQALQSLCALGKSSAQSAHGTVKCVRLLVQSLRQRELGFCGKWPDEETPGTTLSKTNLAIDLSKIQVERPWVQASINDRAILEGVSWWRQLIILIHNQKLSTYFNFTSNIFQHISTLFCVPFQIDPCLLISICLCHVWQPQSASSGSTASHQDLLPPALVSNV